MCPPILASSLYPAAPGREQEPGRLHPLGVRLAGGDPCREVAPVDRLLRLDGGGDLGRLFLALLALVGSRVQRLGRLGAVPVERHRLEAPFPGHPVGVLDVLDRDLVGHVDRLRDRARDEGLGRSHHLDVPVVVDEPLPVLAVLVGGVEDGEVLLLDVGSAFDGLSTADVVVGLVDLLGGEAEGPEQVEVPAGVLVDLEPEPLQRGLTEGEHIEGDGAARRPRAAPSPAWPGLPRRIPWRSATPG